MSLDDIKKTAKSYFRGMPPSHDWQHVQRVHNLSELLAEEESANLKVVKISAYLHDIGRRKEDQGEIEDHADWGAKQTRKILRRYDYRTESIDPIAHCVRAHRYSISPSPETLEAKIIADADNLDAMGAIGIARVFSFSGENDRNLIDEISSEKDEKHPDEPTGREHLSEKILNLKERIHTKSGRVLAEERHAFVSKFIQRLHSEMEIKL